MHGDEAGSVDRNHNVYRLPFLTPSPERAGTEAARMAEPRYALDATRGKVVLEAVRGVCANRGWTLLAAQARTTHVHAVVEAEGPPERIAVDFKAYASRHLNRIEPATTRWTRHASTRWLWKPSHVSAAIEYVISGQGALMSVYAHSEAEPDPQPQQDSKPDSEPRP
jgi:REP element-mobilizing transposase RayT